MIAAASWLSGRVKAVPCWLVWVGALEALLIGASGNSLFPGEALTIVLYISGLGLLVWTVAMSVMMSWRGRAMRTGASLTASSFEV